MDDLRAVGGLGYIRSIIGVILAGLVYSASVFIRQLDRRFVVHIRVVAVAKVANTFQLIAVFVAEYDAHPRGDDVVGPLRVQVRALGLTVRRRGVPASARTSFVRVTGNLNAITVIHRLQHVCATAFRGQVHVYRFLEGALG